MKFDRELQIDSQACNEQQTTQCQSTAFLEGTQLIELFVAHCKLESQFQLAIKFHSCLAAYTVAANCLPSAPAPNTAFARHLLLEAGLSRSHERASERCE